MLRANSLLWAFAIFSTVSGAPGRHGSKQHVWSVGEPVNTTSGRVKGQASPTIPDVSEYLGIRYGQPATGELRFAPPKRYHGHGDVDGSSFVSNGIYYDMLELIYLIYRIVSVSILRCSPQLRWRLTERVEIVLSFPFPGHFRPMHQRL